MIDSPELKDAGRALEIARLRELVKKGFFESEGLPLSEREEQNGNFLILADENYYVARVFYHLKSSKWRTQIFDSSPPKRSEYDSLLNFLRAARSYSEEINLMEIVPRPKQEKKEESEGED